MGDQWILEVKSELECTDPAAQAETWRKRSIYRVPEAFAHLNRKAFVPAVASLGPYHHGQPHLMPMEPHKRRSLVNFLMQTKKPLEDIVEALRQELPQLMDSYDELDEKWRKDENSFLEMMILDGCFVLEVMLSDLGDCGGESSDEEGDEQSDDNGESKCSCDGSERYDRKDPVFGKQHVTVALMVDFLKLENQLPLRALSILASFSKGQIENLNDMILEYFHLDDEAKQFNTSRKPAGLQGLHILDLYRNALLLRGEYFASMTSHGRSAVELREAGVRFQRSESKGFKDISFSNGVLSLPYMEIDDDSEPIFRNLIAYEQLHGAGQEVTAYAFFMDGIINTAKDVALLREEGILKFIVGSDEDTAALFNRLTKEISIYFMDDDGLDVNRELKEYCSTRWHQWRANFVHTYLRNPWVFISLVAAFVLLVLTVVQTVYTLLGYYSA